jgi:hypothetical protein
MTKALLLFSSSIFVGDDADAGIFFFRATREHNFAVFISSFVPLVSHDCIYAFKRFYRATFVSFAFFSLSAGELTHMSG